MNPILNKLEKDGFVNEHQRAVTNMAGIFGMTETVYLSYSVSFEGTYFILHQGGYTGIEQLKNAENIRLEELEKKAKVNQTFLLWLTVLASVGTLLQAIFALAELYWHHGWFGSVATPH